MFSPEAAIHERTQSLRNNKRSRQRTASSDSLNARARQPKRPKRLPLGEDSFPPTDSLQHANGSTERPSSRYSNGVGRRATGHVTSSLDPISSLAVRGKTAKREKRGTRVEDGVELTKTDTYLLTRDRNIPGVLQEIISTEPWHANLCEGLEWAVALTQKRAIIWKYGHTRTLSSYDSGSHVIKFADPSSNSGSRQDAFESLPVGTLVHDAGAGDLALLAVLPGGRIQYFESVRAASDAEATRAKAPATEPLKGTIGGLYSGESITQVTEAEPDGFLLATSYGRLVHLSVRDPQGKPLVHTQFLKAPNTEKSGLFGSIRNALKLGGASQDIVSINPVGDKKGSLRSVVVATSKGVAQAWNIARHGPKTLDCEWDLKSHIIEACRNVSSGLSDQESPNVLDLTLVPAEKASNGLGLHVMALASFSRPSSHKYFLIGLILNEGTVEIDVVHPVRSYDGPEASPNLVGRKFKPRLLVPKPGHTAFIVLDTRLIVISLNRPYDTPDSQLHFEAKDVADNYEESIFYSLKQPFYHTVGCTHDAFQEQSDDASCDIIVHGFGQIRLSAKAVDPKETRGQRHRNSIKSRLEQVVFFGSMSENFLDFRNEAIWTNVSGHEVEGILFEIVGSILDSSSSFIPSVSTSMDLQLKHRIQAMQELNKFVQRWEIPVSTRWKLLWATEKLVAARAIFAVYNESLANRQPGQRMLLEEACDMIPKDGVRIKEPGSGESDRVRHFLTKNVAAIGDIVKWAHMTVDELYNEGVQKVDEQAPLVGQANDIVIKAMESAHKFREANLEGFGLGKDLIIDSIYCGSYTDMDEPPWTCSEELLEKIPNLVYLTTQVAQRVDQLDPENDLLMKFANEQLPALVDITFRAWEEHCRWLDSRPDEATRRAASDYREKYEDMRSRCLYWLTDIGLQIPSTNLAEKYQDMGALAMLTNRIRITANDSLHTGSPEERDDAQHALDTLEEKEQSYFDRFGDHWADSFFSHHLATGQTGQMLRVYPERQTFRTRFLRERKQTDSRICKLSWMNEITCEQRFDEAADDLIRAHGDEQSLWVKQVEMSLAKIAKLAAIERNQLDKEVGVKEVKKIDQRLQIAQKQRDLHEHLKPLLASGIDDSGAHLLVMEAYGSYVSGKPVLEKILAENLSQLVEMTVLNIEDLIDILTLLSKSGDMDQIDDFADTRFYDALWLLHASRLDRADPFRAELTEKCIWRRCILQDDWAALNRTEGKSDEMILDEIHDTVLYKTLVRGFESNLFEAHPPLHPRRINPAGESVADLRKSSRYDNMPDSYLAELAKDHQAEDDLLEEVLNQGRLDARWQGLIDVARADIRDKQDRAGQLAAIREAERQALEQAMEQNKIVQATIEAPPEEPEESQTQQGYPVAISNGVKDSEDTEHRENGVHATSKVQTAPKKGSKKKSTRKTKASKKQEQEEKENKDSEGDVQMFA